LTITTV